MANDFPNPRDRLGTGLNTLEKRVRRLEHRRDEASVTIINPEEPAEGGGGNKPYATVVVAAVNSVAEDAANADFVCDGVDDDVEINAALDIGGRVLLLEGTYNFGAAVNMTDNQVVLEGQGSGSIISAPGVTAVSASFVDDVAIRNLNFIEANIGVSLSNTENAHLDHLTMRGTFTADCVRMVSGNTNVLVTECDFEDCDGFAVNADVVNTLRVDGCNFRDCGNSGALAASARGAILLDATYFAITNCTFYASGQRHIYGTGEHGLIADNVFIQETNPAAAGTTAGIEGAGFTNTIISDNVFEPRGASTSACVRLGTGDTRVTVTDNLFIGGAGTGVDVGGTATDITVQGNYIYGHLVGVAIGASVVRMLLDGNTLRSNTTSISGTPSSTGAGNYIDGVWTPALGTGTDTGPMYFTVAASNAPASFIARADYVCDGTADQVEIQQAITDLGSDGGIIFLSPGLFSLTASINFTNEGAVILQGQGGAGYQASSANEGATIIQRAAAINDDLVSISNSPGSALKGIRFNLASGQTASAQMLSMGIGTLIEDCYIDGVNNAFSSSQAGAGYLTASGTIRNSRFLCTDACIRIRGTTLQDFLIDNVFVRSTDNTTRGAVEIDMLLGGMPDPSSRFPIRINRLRHDGSGAWRIINAKECARLDITNCQLFDFEEAAIHLLNCSDVRISGNNLSGLTSGTEPAINVDGCTFVKVNDNRVDYCGEEAILVNDADDCSIIDNDIIGAGQAADNTFDAIMLNGNTNRCLVDGNVVRVAGANHSRYALRIDDATCDDNAVGVNDFLNGGDSGEISDAGTGTRYLATTSAASFDFAAMEAFGG